MFDKTASFTIFPTTGSLFQSKDEPEGSEGQANWGRLLSGIEIKFRLAVVAEAEGMGESAVSIPKVGGKPDRICLLRASLEGLSTDRHFLGPLRWLAVLRGQSQLPKQFCFGLLHATRGVGIAEGAGDTLQGIDAEPLA